MPLHRRDFMKLLGISIASLYLERGCAVPIPAGCYAPVPPPTVNPPPTKTSTSRERLRLYWLRFGELAQRSPEDVDNQLGTELSDGHRAALDKLVADGQVLPAVAELVQEAYAAAVYHVWRSNAPITCYAPVMIDYAPASANILVEQAEVLDDLAGQGTIDPSTLAKARTALEHDMAFYALTDEEVQALYQQLLKAADPAHPLPAFTDLALEVTPEAKEATRFIIELLTGQ